MKSERWLPGMWLAAALVVVACMGAGCEKDVREAGAGGKQKPASTQPATSPTQPIGEVVLGADPDPATAPQTQTVEAQPAVSFLMIDGLGAQFPPTKLLVHENGDQVRVELFSDLPKSAIKEYQGNELYLEMTLDGGTGPQRLDGASWRYKSTSSEKSDSDNGVFLNGQRRHLQPDDVLVKFERHGDQLLAQVMGQFRAFEPGTPDVLAPFVGIRGELAVDIVEKR